jgi:hypothetical protein
LSPFQGAFDNLYLKTYNLSRICGREIVFGGEVMKAKALKAISFAEKKSKG